MYCQTLCLFWPNQSLMPAQDVPRLEPRRKMRRKKRINLRLLEYTAYLRVFDIRSLRKPLLARGLRVCRNTWDAS
jgi:hypothetical protein